MSKHPAACAFHPLTRVVEAAEYERLEAKLRESTDYAVSLREAALTAVADLRFYAGRMEEARITGSGAMRLAADALAAVVQSGHEIGHPLPCADCGGETQHAASCPVAGVCPMPAERSPAVGILCEKCGQSPNTEETYCTVAGCPQQRRRAACNPLRPGLEAALSLVRDTMSSENRVRMNEYDSGREGVLDYLEGELVERITLVGNLESSQCHGSDGPEA